MSTCLVPAMVNVVLVLCNPYVKMKHALIDYLLTPHTIDKKRIDN